MADPVNPFGKARSFIVSRERQNGVPPGVAPAAPFVPAPVGALSWLVPAGKSIALGADSFDDRAGSSAPGPGRLPAMPHLTFMGGRILDKPKVVNVFVGDYWNTDQGKGDAAHMNGFVNTLGASGLYDMLSSEYNVGRPAYLGNVVIPGAVTKIGPDEIAAAVKQAATSGQVQGGDNQTIYAIHLPPQALLTDGTVDSSQGLGGFHGSVPGADGNPLLFSAIAYGDATNGINFSGRDVNSRDNNTITLSHELAEAITDPDVATAQSWDQIGYYDPLGGEIGDLAVNDGAVDLSEAYARNKDGYAVQIEWSNQDARFEMDRARPPKLLTQLASGPVGTKLSSTEAQLPISFAKNADVTKVLLNLSLINPSGRAPQLRLTSPSGRSIPVPVPAVANFSGPLDITDRGVQGLSAKGTWFLSVVDPNNTGMILSSVSMKVEGTSKEPANEQP